VMYLDILRHLIVYTTGCCEKGIPKSLAILWSQKVALGSSGDVREDWTVWTCRWTSRQNDQKVQNFLQG
jgi:hypothetical protein